MCGKRGNNMLLYKKYLKKYMGYFFIGITFLALESMADLLQPLLIAHLIDDGIAANDLNEVFRIGLMMIGVAFLGLGSALMRNYMATHVSFSFARDLRQGLYEKLLNLSMIQVEEIERGSIINRMTFDVKQVQQFVNGTMRIFLKAPMLAVGSFIMVLQLDNRFIYIYLAVIPLVFVIVALNLKIGYPLFAKIQIELDKLNKKTMEYLNGIRVVKAFNRTAYEKNNFEQVSEKLKDVSTHAMKVMGVFNPIIMLIINLAVVAVLFAARSWMEGGILGVGQIVAFINYMTQLLFAVTIMSRIFNMFIRAKTSNDRITEILEKDVAESTVRDEIFESDMEQGIKVCNLSYKYGEGDFALEGINFKLEQGKSLGIIGPTGSGKSTLVNGLAGLLSVGKGTIHIGDKVLTQANTKDFRNYIGYVPQDKILFSDTIYNNLKLGIGEDQVDLDNHMKEALSTSMADFVYDMEDGLHTKLGKGGVNISGGQKQRLSMARALIKQPKLLVLDDSTSALDAITEKQIFQQLKAGKETMSFIVIGQKISTVKQMDEILVLEDGKMVGLGTHDALLVDCQTYKELYQVQIGGV
jgi:ATP-binding cassette subfamily B protein